MKNESEKYYRVVAMGGHVGKKGYVPLVLGIKAKNGREAAARARYFPRVKHDGKDAILSCDEISISQYDELRRIISEDPYFHCKSIQDQQLIPDFEKRIVPSPKKILYDVAEKERKSLFRYRKQRELEEALEMEEKDYENLY